MAATNVTLPRFSQRQVAKLCGRSRGWVQNHVPRPTGGDGYDPSEVVCWLVERLQQQHETEIAAIESDYQDKDLAAIAKRKKLAEMQNAEALLRINRLKAARLEGKLMRIDWVHHIIATAGAELRKPIEIISRKHPEYRDLIIDALDRAADRLKQIIENDPVDESLITAGSINGNGRG